MNSTETNIRHKKGLNCLTIAGIYVFIYGVIHLYFYILQALSDGRPTVEKIFTVNRILGIGLTVIGTIMFAAGFVIRKIGSWSVTENDRINRMLNRFAGMAIAGAVMLIYMRFCGHIDDASMVSEHIFVYAAAHLQEFFAMAFTFFLSWLQLLIGITGTGVTMLFSPKTRVLGSVILGLVWTAVCLFFWTSLNDAEDVSARFIIPVIWIAVPAAIWFVAGKMKKKA